jgi:hypothetical protein
MAVMETVKKSAEWLEHGKTIVEILISLGAGKVMQAMLVQMTKLPAMWITPLWLFAAAGIMSILMLVGNKRRTIPSSQSAAQTANALVAGNTTFNAGAFLTDQKALRDRSVPDQFRFPGIRSCHSQSMTDAIAFRLSFCVV